MSDNVLLVICLTLLIGAGIPAMIYAGARRGGVAGQVEMLKRAGKRAMKPWEPENRDLERLSQEVQKLQDKPE